MLRSKYYAQNEYLQAVVSRPEPNKPVLKQEADTPFHFRKKNIDSFDIKRITQLKIIDNPDKYADTHVHTHFYLGKMQSLQHVC